MKNRFLPAICALWFSLFSSLAAADDGLPLLGVSNFVKKNSSYNPRGAVFNLDSILGVSGALNVSNGTGHTLSFWMNAVHADTGSNVNYLTNPNPTIVSGMNTACEANANGSPGVCLSFDTSPGGAQLNFNNSTGVSTTTDKLDIVGAGTSTVPQVEPGAVWTHYLISLSTLSYAITGDGGTSGTSAWLAYSGPAIPVGNTISVSGASPAGFNNPSAVVTASGTNYVKYTCSGSCGGTWTSGGTILANNAAIYENGNNALTGGSPPFALPTALATFVGPVDLNDNGWFINSGSSFSQVGTNDQYGWIADVYESAQSIVCTGAGVPFADCTGTNTIPPSYVSKFISGGKPVNLGTNCTGPTGTQPVICLTGSGPAMLTNQGSAAPSNQTFGADASTPASMTATGCSSTCAIGTTSLTLSNTSTNFPVVASGWALWDVSQTGTAYKSPIGYVSSFSGSTLTLSGGGLTAALNSTDKIMLVGPTSTSIFPISSAPYGPAGMPSGQATVRWVAQNAVEPVGSVSSSGIGITAANSVGYGGYPITNGDMLMIWGSVSNSSTTTPTLSCPSTATGGSLTTTGPEHGWTAVGGTPVSVPSGNFQALIVCEKIANSSDNDQYSNQEIKASGTFALNATSVTLASAPLGIQGSVAAGWPVFDYTVAQGGKLLGYVSSTSGISGTTLNLDTTGSNTGALFASSGSTDAIVIGPWVMGSSVAPTRGVTSVAIDVANVNQTTPIDVASCAGNNTAASTLSTPAVGGGTTGSNDTLLSLLVTYGGSRYTQPSTGDNIFRSNWYSINLYSSLYSEYLSGTANPTSRSWSMLSGTSQWLGCAIALNHK